MDRLVDQVSVRITLAEADALRRLAAAEGLTPSALARNALREQLLGRQDLLDAEQESA